MGNPVEGLCPGREPGKCTGKQLDTEIPDSVLAFNRTTMKEAKVAVKANCQAMAYLA